MHSHETPSFQVLRRPHLLAAALWAGTCFASACAAATLTVQNRNDSGTGSLRRALANAAAGDTIVFHPSLSGATIRLQTTTGSLVINRNVTIDGSALPTRVAISGDSDGDGNGDVRVFVIDPSVTATLKGLVIWFGFTPGIGGGILNAGTLTLQDCEVSHHRAAGSQGGGIHSSGSLTAIGSLIALNASESGKGGGIAVSAGPLTLVDSTISGNTALAGGGGVWVGSGAGTVAISGSFIPSNTATGSGGAILNESPAAVSLSGSLLTGNSTDGSGGALAGSFNLIDSRVSWGSAAAGGGGTYVGAGANLTMTGSTMHNNQAGSGAQGGGILVGSQGTITLVNSTLSGNSAGFGGGIYNRANGLVRLASVTLADNHSPIPGGIGGLANAGVVHFTNTLIAESTNGDCEQLGGGTFPTRSGNLVADGHCFSAAFPAVLLGPLGDNGGPTLTHALLPGSPAIDHGDNSYCGDSPGANNRDQRGMPRPIDGDGVPGAVCDIGAFELVVPTVTFFANGFE